MYLLFFIEHKDELMGEAGERGLPGEKGEPGYTPIRGTDYWTEEDVALIDAHIESIVGGVLNASY